MTAATADPSVVPGRGLQAAGAVGAAAACGALLLAGLPWALALAGAWLAGLGVVLTVIDVRTHRLPDRLVLPGAVILAVLVLLAAVTTGEWSTLGRAVLAAAASFTGYLLLGLIKAGGLGFGDVKLAAPLGLWLGWFGWPVVLLGAMAAFLLAGVYALTLLLTRRADRHSSLAFGPWMIAGAALATALVV